MAMPVPAPSSSSSVSNDDAYALAETSAPAPASAPVASPESAAPEGAAAPAPASAAAPASASAPAAEQAKAAPALSPEEAAKQAKAAEKHARARARARQHRRRTLFSAVPAWTVSAIVHLAILTSLAAYTFKEQVKKVLPIDSALVPTSNTAETEATPIYADPSANRSDQAVGSESTPAPPSQAEATVGGGGGFGGLGTGPPSATPSVGRVGTVADGGDGGPGLGGLKLAANVSGLALTPSMPGLDLGGGGMIAGDVTYEAKDVGQSLDQIAHEILRHLEKHKLTVVWLFDESESMKDDQKAIKVKFDRIVNDLKIHVDSQASKKVSEPLTHAIVSFGQDIHYEQEKPSADVERVGQAIDKIRVDDSGVENTLHAINLVIEKYSPLIKKDRRLVIVLVTDESGDDGPYVEEARQAVVSKGVPIYIIGRQSLFGYGRAHLKYVDPVTKDVYWPEIRRGPETADIELLQWDGLHDRWDEQPSGFAPYELARLAKDSGGIYFLLPSEENMRVRTREKAYRMSQLKEYVPDYANRADYVAARSQSELRRTMYEVIQATRGFAFRRHFPVNPADMVPAATEAGIQSGERLNVLLKIQERLEALQKLRDREPEKRWQAHYDLMLAQIVTYQIKAYEYRACMEEMVKKPPLPKAKPSPDLVIEWTIDHSHDRKSPKEKTEKKYIEAGKLLKEVIARHPNTPWADLAQDELNRGFGVTRNEWHHNPQYQQRAALVPKY